MGLSKFVPRCLLATGFIQVCYTIEKRTLFLILFQIVTVKSYYFYIISEIQLESLTKKYGNANYSSGVLKIASVFGNEGSNDTYNNKVIYKKIFQ